MFRYVSSDVAVFFGYPNPKPKPKPKPKPNPAPKAPPANPFCPRDTLKFGVCADVLGLVDLVIGAPPSSKCCALLDGLADLEAAACLCTAIKANVLGIIKVEWDVALNVLPKHPKKKPPPVVLPPIPCPPPPAPETCPIDTLKLGACVDLLGGLVHIGLGDPAVNECCPLLQGLVEIEAAVCLCTTLKIKLLNLNIFLPIALQLLVTCGKTPPPGFTCTL
ncbi:hypothetical protein Syun_011151 [Stephania yunnanensis]|uniref:Bifunctional inhibitor/plant lipid transfer protein/seed storage helical domain-containing protein n=1 Tax=Stephania yunnanensis TaxID=152371 RepID=A0AAP0JX87_9MAGN